VCVCVNVCMYVFVLENKVLYSSAQFFAICILLTTGREMKFAISKYGLAIWLISTCYTILPGRSTKCRFLCFISFRSAIRSQEAGRFR